MPSPRHITHELEATGPYHPRAGSHWKPMPKHWKPRGGLDVLPQWFKMALKRWLMNQAYWFHNYFPKYFPNCNKKNVTILNNKLISLLSKMINILSKVWQSDAIFQRFVTVASHLKAAWIWRFRAWATATQNFPKLSLFSFVSPRFLALD